MTTMLNMIWLLFGGALVSVQYFLVSVLLLISIIGIPFVPQTFKLSYLALWPFGKRIVCTSKADSFLYLLMNFLWIILGGFLIALSHLLLGVFFYLTIIGIPFGKQHLKMVELAIAPFGKDILYV